MIKSFDKIYSIREMNYQPWYRIYEHNEKRDLKKKGKDVGLSCILVGDLDSVNKKGHILSAEKKTANVIVTFISTCQVAERTLFLWNNDYIVRLITSSRKVAADRTTDRTAPKWWFEWKIRCRAFRGMKVSPHV